MDQRIVADDAYLTESIADPAAKMVQGFLPGIMPQVWPERIPDQGHRGLPGDAEVGRRGLHAKIPIGRRWFAALSGSSLGWLARCCLSSRQSEC